MSKWQPIETAPKDGTHILYCLDSAIGCVGIAKWVKMKRVKDRWEDQLGSLWFEPTHWMPLPAPPAGDE